MTPAEAESLRPGDRVEMTIKNENPFEDPRTWIGSVIENGERIVVQWDQSSDAQLGPTVLTDAGVARLERELGWLRLVPMPSPERRRLLNGSWKSPEPSPGPWRVKGPVRSTVVRPSGGRAESEEWVVLDANSKCVATCDRQVDADHIAQNGPR